MRDIDLLHDLDIEILEGIEGCQQLVVFFVGTIEAQDAGELTGKPGELGFEPTPSVL
ncbi:MAG: hypothetical protein GWO24_14745, partial [Akkermansiaceae bacterium]|nr:hypothetical protein [Akkermansiaceae bacterium]